MLSVLFINLRNRRGETPVFRRGMKAPVYTFIIQWFLVYSYHVDKQVQKEHAHEFYDEDEDMIEYRYSIDVAVLLKDNFQNLLN